MDAEHIILAACIALIPLLGLLIGWLLLNAVKALVESAVDGSTAFSSSFSYLLWPYRIQRVRQKLRDAGCEDEQIEMFLRRVNVCRAIGSVAIVFVFVLWAISRA